MSDTQAISLCSSNLLQEGAYVTFYKRSLADHHAEKVKLRSLVLRKEFAEKHGEPSTGTTCPDCNLRQHATLTLSTCIPPPFKTIRSLSLLSANHILHRLTRTPRLKWPVRNISRTNNSLTDEEEDALRTAIVQLEAYIAARSTLPAPKARFRLGLINSNDVKLKLERAHLQRLRGRLSIVHSLPPEIVREILIAGADVTSLPGGRDYSNSRTRKARFGFKVAHISRYWRDIALSTSELWSCLPTLRIKYKCQDTKVQEPSPALALYEFMLKHSRGCPLDISIEQYWMWDTSRQGRRRCTAKILDLLLNNSERWRVANLDLQDSFLLSMGHRIRNKLPQLEVLYLSYSHFTIGAASQPTEHWDIFKNAPKLRHIFTFFWNGNHAFQFPQFPQPLVSFVVHMNGHIGETALLNWALESQNSVERLEFYSLTPSPLPHNTLFSRLRQLHIDPAFEGCLDAFTAPSLEELVVIGCHNDMLLRELLDMLQRSHAASMTGVLPLKRLSIRYPLSGYNANLVIGIFESTPLLEYLEMPLPTASVLSRLAELAPSPLLPELQHLIFRLCTPVTYDIYYAVNTVARSRCEKPQSHEPNSFSESIEPIQLFALLPYVAAVQSKEDLARSRYALEDNWDRIFFNTPSDSAFGPSPTIRLPTKAAHLPEWAQAIDSCCPREKCISEQGVKDWINALESIQWNDIDARCYEYSRLLNKLNDTRLVLKAKNKQPVQHISHLTKVLEYAHERWRSIIDAQLPTVHWTIQYDLKPLLHALLYVPQHDDIRSREPEDAQLMIDVTASQDQGPFKLCKYYKMFRDVETHYALSENVVRSFPELVERH